MKRYGIHIARGIARGYLQSLRLVSDRRELTDVAAQEFSIEIPDKDADTIHSGMSLFPQQRCSRN